MATYLFSTLQNNQRIEFNLANDVFEIDDKTLKASQLQYQLLEPNGNVIAFTHQGKTVTLSAVGLLGGFNTTNVKIGEGPLANGAIYAASTFVSLSSGVGRGGPDLLIGVGGSGLVQVFVGSAGADRFDGYPLVGAVGGAGENAVDYRSAPSGVNVNLALGTAADGTGSVDTLTHINFVIGTRFGDVIVGTPGTTVSFERFLPQGGNDSVDGGAITPGSINFLDYQTFFGSVSLDLQAGSVKDSDGASGTLKNINWVRGGFSNDVLKGSNAVYEETFEGYAGADAIDGRGGPDTISYVSSSEARGAFISLLDGEATDPYGSIDTLIGIENAIGSGAPDVLLGSVEANQLRGLGGDDFLEGMAGNDIFDGGSGTDTITFGFSPARVVVDLAAGTASDGWGGSDTLISIESVRGTPFDDRLIGSANAPGIERFDGGFGSDFIDGGALLAGSSGGNIASYLSAPAGTIVNLATGTASDGTGGVDTLRNINMIEGSAFGDSMTGNAGPAIDFEVFFPGAGNDAVDGGVISGTLTPDSRNVVNYSNASAAAKVDLRAGTANDGFGGTDTLANINWVIGSKFGDELAGSDLALDERFEGAAGADRIDGREGSDTVSYQTGAVLGVTVNLTDGIATDWSGATDKLTSIEHAIGTGFVDALTGDASSNSLWGLGGNDVLVGLAGDDSFTGGDGNDQLNGGVGIDSANFALRREDYLVSKTGTGFTISAKSGGEGVDTLTQIESVAFSDFALSLVTPPAPQGVAFNTDSGFLFDLVYFRFANTADAVALTASQAREYYFATGAALGKAPNSWFDASYYKNKWADLEALNLDDATLFAHYNRYGVWEGRSGGAAFDKFDGSRYLADNALVAGYVDSHLSDFLGSRTNGAIAHFIIYGQGEGRAAYDTTGAAIDLGWSL